MWCYKFDQSCIPDRSKKRKIDSLSRAHPHLAYISFAIETGFYVIELFGYLIQATNSTQCDRTRQIGHFNITVISLFDVFLCHQQRTKQHKHSIQTNTVEKWVNLTGATHDFLPCLLSLVHSVELAARSLRRPRVDSSCCFEFFSFPHSNSSRNRKKKKHVHVRRIPQAQQQHSRLPSFSCAQLSYNSSLAPTQAKRYPIHESRGKSCFTSSSLSIATRVHTRTWCFSSSFCIDHVGWHDNAVYFFSLVFSVNLFEFMIRA